MSDEVTPPVVPVVVVDPPKDPPKGPSFKSQEDFNARLEQAKRSVLTELGFSDVKDVKAVVDAHKQTQEASKTELQKAQEKAALYDQERLRADSMASVIQERATAEMATLTEAQRSAVIAAAGDSPAAQLRVVTALRPTWVAAAPASTTSAAPAPAAVTTTNPNHRQIYEDMKKQNPFAASHYLLKHQTEIVS